MMPESISSDADDPTSMRISPREMTIGEECATTLRELLKSGEMCELLKSEEVDTMSVDGEEGMIPLSGLIGTMSGITESTIDSLMRCFQ